MRLVLEDKLDAKDFGFLAGNIFNLSLSTHVSGLPDINDLVARYMHVRLIRLSTLNEYRLRDRQLCIRVCRTMTSGRYPYESTWAAIHKRGHEHVLMAMR